MPSVKSPQAFEKAYLAAKQKIRAREIPTQIIPAGQTLYRSVNPASPYTQVTKPRPGGHVSKHQVNKLLIPADSTMDLKNRFSGPPPVGSAAPAAGGLYFVLQQQALVNESTHYSRKVPFWALAGRCVLVLRTMGALMVADISPHNPGGQRFVRELGKDVWQKMTDPDDCSVARGIGLAIAESGFMHGISVQTVRMSERSAEERGDNLVLFAAHGQAVPNVYIDEALFFGKTSTPEVFPVAFP